MNICSHFKYQTIPLPSDILAEKMAGHYDYARELINARLADDTVPAVVKKRLELELMIMDKMERNYGLTRQQLLSQMQEEIPDFTDDELSKLLLKGYVDFAYIGGEKKFLNSSRDALIKSYPELWSRSKNGDTNNSKLLQGLIYSLNDGDQFGSHFHIKQEMILHPQKDVLGQTSRIYVPITWKSCPRIKNFKMLAAEGNVVHIAGEDAPMHTVLFEEKAEEGNRVSIEYEYDYIDKFVDVFNYNPENVTNNVPKEIAEKYLGEELPHIVFSNFMKEFAKEIIGDETNNLLKAKKIYTYITTKFRYRYVRSYASIENVPEYMAVNRRGDCGIYAMLFINLCRVCGIPAHWESGIVAKPNHIGSHDWALFYVDGLGWRHADLSFGGGAKLRGDERRWQFYFGNVDQYRIPFNQDCCTSFEPPMNFFRSDPTDNQSGETEFETRISKHGEVERVVSAIEITDLKK